MLTRSARRLTLLAALVIAMTGLLLSDAHSPIAAVALGLAYTGIGLGAGLAAAFALDLIIRGSQRGSQRGAAQVRP